MGYGFIGRRHVESLRGIDGWSIPAVCDCDQVRLDEILALHPETQTYLSYADLLAQADVDAVVISVPNNRHKEIAVAAAQAGKNSLLEKPAAMTVAEFDQIMEAARKPAETGRSVDFE
ncbi:MAG: Gfo/Idh/MocA family oxidoreductase [Actinomycetaceae bacterium]|nr:Gfo/Idh/MocA family oxidoreductase [Actinomycetaceae bacterium]